MSEHSPRPALSPVVAGCWRLAEWGWSAPERLRWIEQCLERGVTTFDHADIYGGYSVEALFGEALALGPQITSLALREARELFEREYLLAQINRFGGNISRTAQFVGMERSALHRKLKSLGVVGGVRVEDEISGK